MYLKQTKKQKQKKTRMCSCTIAQNEPVWGSVCLSVYRSSELFSTCFWNFTFKMKPENGKWISLWFAKGQYNTYLTYN
jgi:hypothetical protein